MRKRLLCIVGGMNTGGAETFIMKLYRELDKTKYQIDFCVSSEKEGYYDNEILTMGGIIHHIIAKSRNPFTSFYSIYKVVKKGNYKYAMRISQHSLSTLELLSAKAAGAKVLVFRSSNSNTMRQGIEARLHKLFSFLPRIVPNVKIAPSIPAAEFMFGKKSVEKNKVLLLKNAIPIDKFVYNKKQRDNIRSQLGIENVFVIGHIGRFTNQKNHEYLIRVFYDFKKLVSNTKLILIGTGEKEEKIKDMIKELQLEDDVLCLGIRSDIPDLLMAMDIFVFPSFFEGMPNTVIEAQATGLRCIISDTITKEADITGLIDFIPLEINTDKWVNIILFFYKQNDKRNDMRKTFIRSGYDIKNSTECFINAVFNK